MAHSFKVKIGKLGDGDMTLRIEETDCAPDSVVPIPASMYRKLPAKLRVLAQKAELVAGSGSTLDPKLSNKAHGLGISIVVENDVPSEPIHNQPLVPVLAELGDGLFHRSRPSSGSDNVVNTVYFLREGW